MQIAQDGEHVAHLGTDDFGQAAEVYSLITSRADGQDGGARGEPDERGVLAAAWLATTTVPVGAGSTRPQFPQPRRLPRLVRHPDNRNPAGWFWWRTSAPTAHLAAAAETMTSWYDWTVVEAAADGFLVSLGEGPETRRRWTDGKTDAAEWWATFTPTRGSTARGTSSGRPQPRVRYSRARSPCTRALPTRTASPGSSTGSCAAAQSARVECSSTPTAAEHDRL
ncbi:hypothetical protein ACU686_12500 [Yinghuangia aomiensis]